MTQIGLHGLIGLYAGSKLAPGRPWLRGGVVLGSLLPSLDCLLDLAAWLLWPLELPLGFRPIAHSLVGALVPLAVCLPMSVTGGARYRNLGLGLSLGMAFHGVSDALIWLSPVDWLWPITVPRVADSLTAGLWPTSVPVRLGDSLLAGLELLGLLGYLLWLYFEGRAHGAGRSTLAWVRGLIVMQVVGLGVYTTLAISMGDQLPAAVAHAPAILATPVALYSTLRLWPALETGSLPGGPAVVSWQVGAATDVESQRGI